MASSDRAVTEDAGTAGGLPRTLIVVVTKIKADDPASLLPRMQFSRWPAGRLAQIFSGETAGKGDFCGRYYQIGPQDRRFGRLFMRLRASALSAVAMEAPVATPGRGATLLQRIKRGVADLLIHSGFWEVVFGVRVSPDMDRFIREFKPEVIYCTGYHLGFAVLPMVIARRYGVPICFQTFEDWPTYTARHSPVGVLIRRKAAELIRMSAVRLAFGPKMKRMYEARYGVPFEVSYHLDDPARFLAVARPAATDGPRRIVFTGALVLNRLEAIADVLQAVRSLIQRDSAQRPIVIDVYCPGVPQDMAAEMREAPEVRWLPLPSHEALPEVLAQADVLLLPEAFSVGERRLGLALSTKCHLYMLSGRPILVYGPAYAGTVEYAREGGWARVVQDRDTQQLAGAITELLAGRGMTEMRAAAQRCIAANHDLAAGRQRFETWMVHAAATDGVTREASV